ncbi:MAG: hypothetical protein FWF60_00285 [Oscillospiraceae bacterium]|nr:hypothetical protein [Oscillospiraceae bacterium]
MHIRPPSVKNNIKQAESGGIGVIKGVNHRVIEVMDSGSEYFERVIFFVKPEYSALSEGTLRDRARAVAGNASAPPPSKILQARLATVGALLGAAGVGAAVAFAVQALL